MTEGWEAIERALEERGGRCALRCAGADLSGADVLASLGREPGGGGRREHEIVPIVAETAVTTLLDLLAVWKRRQVTFLLPAREPAERYLDLPDTTELPGAATILCTSGSSGRPKLVVHGLRQHLASARAAAGELDLEADDTWLLNLPLHHVGGLAPVFRALVSGARLEVPAEGEKLPDTLRRTAPTHVSVVATQLRRCLDDEAASAALARAKVVLCGGGPFDVNLLDRALDRGVPVAMSYGSTETASMVTVEREPAFLLEQGCAGTALPGRRVRIADDGQILVAGDTLLSGYLEGPSLRDASDANGWFATGDVGHLAGDGRLTIVGRRDRMFISGGENIHPEEIEWALRTVPGVAEAVVEPFDHPVYGRRPAALVRLEPGASNFTGADLVGALVPRLARFKIPDRFYRLPGRELL